MLIMLLALFLVTMFLGTPIAFSMSFASIVTNLTHGASSLMLTAQQCTIPPVIFRCWQSHSLCWRVAL